MYELRSYQNDSVSSVLQYWENGGGNPLVEMATGTGKSLVIAALAKHLRETYSVRVLMLVHVRELVAQNAKAMLNAWPDAPLGIYSAGLNKRDTHHPVLFGSIQSVYKRGEMLGQRDVVLIDEAHLIPRDGDGMYLKLLSTLRRQSPDLRICGFTATPFRLDSGRLDEGDGRLFNDTVYKYDIARGVDDKYLSPLIAKRGAHTIDTGGVKKTAGEFNARDLEDRADTAYLVEGAADEIVAHGKDRKSWLVFCCGIEHAKHACEALRDRGIVCETVSSETPMDKRDSIIGAFKRGQIQCLTNAMVLTTGFDAPRVDMIALLRPTLSTGLYVQMLGRGTRISEGKSDCLVLDFGSNVMTHGPVDALDIKVKAKGDGTGESPAKICPGCQSIIAAAIMTCPQCGHEWPPKEVKHNTTADTAPIMTRDIPPKPYWTDLRDCRIDRWKSKDENGTDSLIIEYLTWTDTYRQWMGVESIGYARELFVHWWISMGGQQPIPKTIDEALSRAGDELHEPMKVHVEKNPKNPKYWNPTEIVIKRRDGSLIEINMKRWNVKAHKDAT